MKKNLTQDELVERNRQFVQSLDSLKNLIEDDLIAQDLWGALSNTTWISLEDDFEYSCSFRFAGGLVANLRGKGETYMEFYCSGNAGYVSPIISTVMSREGWTHKETTREEERLKPPFKMKFKLFS